MKIGLRLAALGFALGLVSHVLEATPQGGLGYVQCPGCTATASVHDDMNGCINHLFFTSAVGSGTCIRQNPNNPYSPCIQFAQCAGQGRVWYNASCNDPLTLDISCITSATTIPITGTFTLPGDTGGADVKAYTLNGTLNCGVVGTCTADLYDGSTSSATAWWIFNCQACIN